MPRRLGVARAGRNDVLPCGGTRRSRAPGGRLQAVPVPVPSAASLSRSPGAPASEAADTASSGGGAAVPSGGAAPVVPAAPRVPEAGRVRRTPAPRGRVPGRPPRDHTSRDRTCGRAANGVPPGRKPGDAPAGLTSPRYDSGRRRGRGGVGVGVGPCPAAPRGRSHPVRPRPVWRMCIGAVRLWRASRGCVLRRGRGTHHVAAQQKEGAPVFTPPGQSQRTPRRTERTHT